MNHLFKIYLLYYKYLDIYNERPSKDDQQIIPIQTNHQIGSQVN